MFKEIRITCQDIYTVPSPNYSMIQLLADRGFPVDNTFNFALKPRDGLEYTEFFDSKTGDFVVRWED